VQQQPPTPQQRQMSRVDSLSTVLYRELSFDHTHFGPAPVGM